MVSHDPGISILIATFRGINAISWPLSQIASQRLESIPSVELVVVDHGNPPEFGQYVKRHEVLYQIDSFKFISLYPSDTYKACYARNMGIMSCTKSLVFFMHDYTTLEGEDYLARIWEASQQGKRAVGTHKIVHEPDGGTTTVVTGFFAHQDAVPLEYMQKVNGFDESFDGDHGFDDLDLLNRIKAAGCEVVEEKELVSYKYKKEDFYMGSDGKRNENLFHKKWG
jgi:glycosyltransferase involved in cell wall biosynthesis